jgi:hypothetical protein
MTAEEYIQVEGTAKAGGACSPNGLMAQDGTGTPLFCINGTWSSVSVTSTTSTTTPTGTPSLALSTTNVVFPGYNVSYGGTTDESFTVTSNGTAAVTLSAINASYTTSNGSYTTLGGSCQQGLALQPGQSCTVDIIENVGNDENTNSWQGVVTLTTTAGQYTVSYSGYALD